MSETLHGPALDVYKLICNTQGLEVDYNSTVACFECYEFLNEVHHFILQGKSYSTNTAFQNELNTKYLNVDLKDMTDNNRTKIDIKIEEVDIEIDKSEVIEGKDFVEKDNHNSESIIHEIPLLSDANERPYVCTYCGLRSKSKNQLSVHLKRHLNKHNKPFECSECSYKSAVLTDLRQHAKHMHSDERPFECDQCGFRTKTKSSLSDHIKRHTLKKIDQPFKCSECSYKTAIERNLKNHIVSEHNNERPFPCNSCDYRAKTKSQLGYHVKSHIKVSDTVYQCDKCPYITLNPGYLKHHIKSTHSDERPFSCDQCDYRCKNRENLTRHKEKHLINCDKPFKCTKCPYKTSRLDYLRKHNLRTHSDNRPYSCDHCDYRAKRRANLDKHLKGHFKEDNESFKCSECSYKTSDSRYLKNHSFHSHGN